MNIDIADLQRKLEVDNRALLAKFDPHDCISAFDGVSSESSYHEIPNRISILWNNVLGEFGNNGFDAFQRITMLRLIRSFDSRAAAYRYSESVRSCFERSFIRIAKSIADPSFDNYRDENDILYKDLGLCRQKIFPAGAQVVERDSGFHRSLMFRGGLRQGIEVAKLLMNTGGNRHWYQIHTHLSELEDFNQQGWDACYLRLADMLFLNPEIRGMWGGSWFYDPALNQVSPRLNYLREIPQQHGARLFFSGIDIDGGALSRSETRKRAYESGEYLPRSYTLIWPRKPLLEWAENARGSA